MTRTFYSKGRAILPDRTRLVILALAFLLLLFTGSISRVAAQSSVTVDLGAGEFGEVRTAGFVIADDSRVSIETICFDPSGARPLASNAWILDASTRMPVWEFNTHAGEQEDQHLRKVTDEISLPAGTYEVYYASYTDWNRGDWNPRDIGDIIRNVIRELFDRHNWHDDEDFDERFKELQSELGIQIRTSPAGRPVTNVDDLADGFLSTAFLTITGVPDDRYVAEGFELKRPLDIDVYAVGEFVQGEAFDHAWIASVDSRQKVWEMSSANLQHAGGAEKNRLSRDQISLEPGRYAAFYSSDGSHSPTEWNAIPPYDPDFWGLTLRVPDADDLRHISRFDYENISLDHAVVKLRGLGDDQHQTAGFSVVRPLEIRIYAIGEGRGDRMFDYGWIVNTDTREQVWRMDYASTDHAGGASKNRVFDGVIKLDVGNYIVHFMTDGSHSYEDWNSDRPFDAAAWGVTIAPVDADDSDRLATYSPADDRSTLARITEVIDGENREADFTLEKEGRIRVFAVGEGLGGEMYDYGWIENLDDGTVVWEMTYRMTEHAGGASKNRMVNTVLMLPAGTYRVHYTSDGSHSFGDWNDAAPHEPEMWGITVSHDRRRSGI